MEETDFESKIEEYLRNNLSIEVENDFGDSYLKVTVNLNNTVIDSDYVNVRNIIKSI